WTDDHKELSVAHGQVDLLQHMDGAERLLHLLECNLGHPLSPPLGYARCVWLVILYIKTIFIFEMTSVFSPLSQWARLEHAPLYNLGIAAEQAATVKGVTLDTTRYSAPALEKGLDIIELLAGHPEGLSLVELARALGRTTAEIFRMVVVLQTRGYLVALGERYALSLLLFQLA